jgi:glutaminyl-peptide cyclotransferase
LKNRSTYLAGAAIFLLLFSCGPENKSESMDEVPVVQPTPVIPYTIVARYPHDVTAFTEGLLFHEGKLFESTGAPSNLPETYSCFGIVDLETGKINRKAELDKKIYFGEGILLLNDNIYQLTYTNQICFIYDAKTFAKKGQFSYPNKEGWGMTTDGTYMIFSDGTESLTYIDPGTYSVVKQINVTENGFAVTNLNELEYINGYIYANVWMSNDIVKINPETGEVVGKLVLDLLFKEARAKNPKSAETNGIAYDAIKDRIVVTGKLWPVIFEIDFKH